MLEGKHGNSWEELVEGREARVERVVKQKAARNHACNVLKRIKQSTNRAKKYAEKLEKDLRRTESNIADWDRLQRDIEREI